MGGRLVRILLVSVVLLGSAFCAGRQQIRGVETSGLDRKLSTFAYIEEGDLVSLIVDTRTTRLHENEDFIPLEVCVANRGLRVLTLTRESFALIDQDGNRYEMASPRDLLDHFEFLDFDRRLQELEGIVYARFATFTRYRSTFSPTRLGPYDPREGTFDSTGSTVKDRVSLPRFGFMIDMIYFPKPPGGVMNRRFELHMTAPELPDPVFVKFEVL